MTHKNTISRIDTRSIGDLRAAYPDAHIQAFDAGRVYDAASDSDVVAVDVIVWASEEDSDDDDGSRAIDRVLIRA